MESKHTETKWSADGPYVYGKKGGLDVCVCMVSLLARRPKEQPSRTEKQGRKDEQERCAIARLIAAAPELLAACKNFFEWHANHFESFDDETNGQLLCLANQTEAAIAKAQ